VPTEVSVTVAPDTVQEKGGELKLTGRPEDAVALKRNGAVPYAWFGSGPKAIVWFAGEARRLTLTGVAAA
jgi:hypothetical protein